MYCEVCHREDGSHWTVPHVLGRRKPEPKRLNLWPYVGLIACVASTLVVFYIGVATLGFIALFTEGL